MAEKPKKTENAIVASQMQFNGGGLEVRTLTDMKLVAETFITSGLVPKHFNTTAKIIVAIQAGREMGFGFWESLTKLHVVNGRIGMEAKAMKAKALASGKCKVWKEEKIGTPGETDEGYEITIEREENQGGSVTFTRQDAITAGLANKENWKNYPDDMLWNRATSKACRRWFDDVIYVVYTPDELSRIQVDSTVIDEPRSAELLKEPESPPIDESEQPAEDNIGIPVFNCPDAFKSDSFSCSIAESKKELRIDDDHLEQDQDGENYICPECGSVLKQIRVE